METLWQDLKYGIRMLTSAPLFTLVAVLTLALGAGANTAIFSVINGILLRPLPYAQPERLMFFTEWSEQVPEMSFSVANFKDVRDQNTRFESMVAYNGQDYVLTGEGDPERLRGRRATIGLLPTLGIQPILGRGFTPEEDKPGGERVVLLAEGYWTRRFARDPNILGRKLALNGESYSVIGVLPGRMHGSWRRTDVFTSLGRLEDDLGGEKNRGNHPGIYVIARLKPGATEEQGRTEILGIARRLSEQYPASNARQSMTVQSLHHAIVGDVQRALVVLLAAVAFVLLIACVNVANLLLGRAAVRQKEIGVRMAMGAGRGRLMRQLLTESVLLSVIGGSLGLLLAYASVKWLVASLPTSVPRVEEIRMDAGVLAFTGAISILIGLLFGIIPAWKVTRTNLHDTLKEGGRGTPGAGHHRVRSVLAVTEISLALVLLVGAGLMLRSFFRVMHADPGFNAEGVLTAVVSLPQTKYKEPVQVRNFIDQVLQNVKAMPGVQAAGSTLPLLGGWQSSFIVEGRPEPPPGQKPSSDISRVSTDYFRAMGVRLLKGREFTERDNADAPPVCIIDETFARTFWPNEDPLGKKIKFGRADDKEAKWMEVVGVVAHVKNYGVDQSSRVETYYPYMQRPIGFFTLVIRTAGSPTSLIPGVRQAVIAVDRDVPISEVQTLAEIVADNTAERRMSAVLLAIFAALALLLAAVGIYGVMSYSVSQRTQEIGIRMALGAQPRHILRMILGHGAIVAGVGVVLGLAAAFGLARLIASLLFQVSTTDPPTFAVVPILLMAVALLACYVPARRATRVDPMIALRNE